MIYIVEEATVRENALITLNNAKISPLNELLNEKLSKFFTERR